MTEQLKPEPVPKAVACSVCGLAWDKHTARLSTSDSETTVSDCVALLKAELSKRSSLTWSQSAPLIATTTPYRTVN